MKNQIEHINTNHILHRLEQSVYGPEVTEIGNTIHQSLLNVYYS